MGIELIWHCDVCRRKVEDKKLFEVRAYGCVHIDVCESCLGEKAAKVACKRKWKLRNDSQKGKSLLRPEPQDT